MPRLEWRDLARADLLEIISYIADDNPGAAQQLLDELKAKADQLLQHPKAYGRGVSPAPGRWSVAATSLSMPRMPAT